MKHKCMYLLPGKVVIQSTEDGYKLQQLWLCIICRETKGG